MQPLIIGIARSHAAKYLAAHGIDARFLDPRHPTTAERVATMERLLAETRRLDENRRFAPRKTNAASTAERLKAAVRRTAHADGRWQTACHEAGHAWCAHSKACSGLSFASIRPTAEAWGVTTVRNLFSQPLSTIVDTAMAGPAAGAMAARGNAMLFDLDSAGNSGDRECIDHAIQHLTGSERKSYLATARTRVALAVATAWPKIEALARELIAVEWIGKPGIAAILDGA